MKQLQMIQITPDELKDLILVGIKAEFQDLKKHFQPKQPTEYLTRNEVAKMFKIDLSTVHNWTKKGILTSFQIGGRILYKRDDVEKEIV